MEEDIQIISVDMNKVVPTSLAFFNKKRKFEAEQLGMPLSKHMCSYQSHAECSAVTEAKESLTCMMETQNDDSEAESEKDSNSFTGDADSVTSGESKTDPLCPSDQASLNWSGKDLYSLESRSVTKPIGKEHHWCEWGSLMNYGNHTCPERRADDIELSTKKELEKLLHSNGTIPSNYVLSSGRWTVKQDADPGPKKLTIDKEFEQYFSMLML